jgi:hypothetical protein
MFSDTEDKDFQKQIEDIKLARNRGWVIDVLTVYGDESSDEKEQRIFCVVGIWGRQEEWDKLDSKWMKRTNGIPFHAADCESGHGPYKDIPHNERKQLYADLVKMIAATNFIGYGVSIDLWALRGFIPDAVKNTPYLLCFREVIMRFTRLTSVLPGETVEFIFDMNSKTSAGAAALYNHMIHARVWKYKKFMADKISFACRKTVGIQVADIIARETLKRCDSLFMQKEERPLRQSMQLLLSTERYKFMHLDEKFFDREGDRLTEDPDPFDPVAYMQWLAKKKRQDNISNKYNFLLDVEETDFTSEPES